MGHKGREYIRCFKVTTFEITRVTLDGPLDRGCFDAVRVRHLYPARFKPSIIRARRSMRPQVRRCPYAYGLDSLSALSFQSLVDTYNYNLASYRVSRLQAISTKTHLLFQTEPKTYKHGNETMCSFDVTSLFTNVPLDEKIHICFNKLELFLSLSSEITSFSASWKIYKVRWPMLRPD